VIPRTRVETNTGYLFQAAKEDNFCFVPAMYVTESIDGTVEIDELGYFENGWSIRNMRWSSSESGGSHLFPDQSRPVISLEDPKVQQFLRRVSARTNHPFSSLGR
jgi:hypothetical protein